MNINDPELLDRLKKLRSVLPITPARRRELALQELEAVSLSLQNLSTKTFNEIQKIQARVLKISRELGAEE